MKIAVLFNRRRWANSVLNAFERSGHEIHPIYVDTKPMAEIFNDLEKIGPDFCYAHNFYVFSENSPTLTEDLEMFFSENKFPFAVWYLDNPRYQGHPLITKRWQRLPYPKNCLFFINDKSFGPFFEERKVPYRYLPIGVCRDIQGVAGVGSWPADIRFTGQPSMRCSLETVTIESMREAQKNLYFGLLLGEMKKKLGISEQEGVQWLQRLADRLDLFFDRYYTTKEEYFSAEDAYYHFIRTEFPERVRDVILDCYCILGVSFSWYQMTAYLLELVPKGLLVQGSVDWKGFFPAQKEELRRLSWPELFQTYRDAKINFCFTKWTLPTAVHDRVYEVLVAGGFPLTDFRESLPEAFEKDEIAVYRTIEEAKDLIDFYLREDSERMKLIEKGRARVLSSHTYDHRLTHMIKDCKDFWGL